MSATGCSILPRFHILFFDTVELISSASGLSKDKILSEVAVVDNKSLERLLKELGKEIDKSSVTLLKAELAAKSNKSYSPRFWAKEIRNP